MSLQGKFLLNDNVDSELIVFGVGSFKAFSGQGTNRNHGGCQAVPSAGPIPPGKYWILDRPEGGALSQIRTGIKDTYNRIFNGASFNHGEWFALYRNDGEIDDYTWVEGVKRGNFRLHPGQISEGCITLPNEMEYSVLRSAILRYSKQAVPGARALMSYGTIEVIAYGRKNCP